MAIRVDILEAAGFGQAGNQTLPVIRLPLITTQQIVAAGTSAVLDATTSAVMIKNSGDEVFIKPRDADNTDNAGAAVAGSFTLETGEILLLDVTTNSNLEFDIRATA